MVTTIFGFVVAVLDTLALWALGVPVPLVWGLLSFLTNYIPNVGFIIGLIPPALLGLLDGGWGTMLAVVAVYCVINVVLQTFVQPRFVGDAVGLSALMTFLSLALWAALAYLIGWGWSGLVVAVIWAVIAAILYLVGRAQLKKVKGAPQTAETLQEIPQTFKRNEENR